MHRPPRHLARLALPSAAACLLALAGCSSIETDAGYQDGSNFGAEDEADGEPEETEGEPSQPPPADTGEEEPAEPTPEPPRQGADPPIEPFCGDGQGALPFVAANGDSLTVPAIVRAAVLDDGDDLPGIPISRRAFLNYYSLTAEAPELDSLEVSADLWEIEKGPDDQLRLQLSISTMDLDAQTRPPIHAVLVLDASSRSEGERLEIGRAAIEAAATALEPGDHLSLITVGDQTEIVLEHLPVDGPEDAVLLSALAELEAAGDSTLDDALALAHALSAQYEDGENPSRIVLLSGGGPTLDPETLDELTALAETRHGQGSDVVALGLGPLDGYDDALIRTVADAGRGPALFAGNEDDAWSLLGEQFASHMITSARDLEVEVVLPTGLATPEPADADGQLPYSPTPVNLGYSDTLTFHQQVDPCDALADDAEIGIIVRWRDGALGEGHEQQFVLPMSALSDSEQPSRVHKAAAIVAYADALESLQLEHADAATVLFHAQAMIESAIDYLPDDSELIEMADILQQLSAR